jgi:outer membrane lipoprotein carrier protein
MNHRISRRVRLSMAVAVLALSSVRPVGPAVADLALDDVIRQIEARYARIDDLKASFDQTAFNRSLNQSIPAQGAVYLKRGGKMRWEYSAPTPQQIVSDGKTIWVYTPELKQVNVGEAPRVLAGPAGSFLAGLGKLRTHFTVKFQDPAKKRDAAGNYVLDLTPRKPEPSLVRLIIAVDPREYLVRSAEVFDQFDNTVTMAFTKISQNSGLPDKLFAFVPPEGVATVPFELER